MVESGMLNEIIIDEKAGHVTVMINLTKDYRKAKEGISALLYNTLEWVEKVDVKMAKPPPKKAAEELK